MKQARKWIAILSSAAVFLTAAGCEMSSIAATSTEPPQITLTPEEQEELDQLIREVLGEDYVLENAQEGSEETSEEVKTETPQPSAEEKMTVIEQAEALLNDPDYLLDDNGHGHRSFEELRAAWRDVNPEALDPYIEELAKYNEENPEDKDAEKTVVTLYNAICEAYNREYVQSSIGEVLFDEDVTNEEIGEKKARGDTELDLLSNRGKAAIRDALNGFYGDVLREVIDPNQVEVYLSTQDLSERAIELSREANELSVEYSQAMAKPVSCEIDGTTYTSEDTDISPEMQSQVKTALGFARSEQITPIYQRLIRNRNEYAQELGYQNYIEYAYRDIYGRDYTAEDVKKLVLSIYQDTLAVMTMALLCKGDADLTKPVSMENETLLKTLRANIGKVSPTLNESLDYLQKYGLYSFGDEAVRRPGAFMADIPTSRAGYIYIDRDNTIQDYETLTHEFGHYNNAYSTYSPNLAGVPHMDVLEIHSQGLEMLGSTTLDDVFPTENGDYSAAITISMIQAVTSAMMVAAFEIESFENPDRTSEEYVELMSQYARICMLGTDSDTNISYGIFWPNIHHLFQSPLYYVSYAISALSALDIYAEYLEDPEEAVECYLKLVHVSPDVKYVEAVRSAGLRDMTREENIREVMDILNTHYQEEFMNRMISGVQNGEIGDMISNLILDLAGG